MKISDWIKKHPGTITTLKTCSSLDEAVSVILEGPCLHDIYVISEDGRVTGHLSCRRIFHTIFAEHRPVHTRRQLMERISVGTAGELMDSHFVYAGPDEKLDDVIHRQLENDLEDMPVLDDQGRLIGMVNIRKVLKKYYTQKRTK